MSIAFALPTARLRLYCVCFVSLLGLMLHPNPACSAVAVLTHHNDLNRTGANLNETLLTTNNVNTNQFGLLYTRAVDDEIHTQPLIVTNVNVPGKGVHNLVIVATVNDSVYAFDAEERTNSAPLWQTNFLNANAVPPRNTDMTYACSGNYKDFAGKIGIVGTPVIDPSSGTLYLVARTKEFGTNYIQRLWALDVSTGTAKPNGVTTIPFAVVNGGQIQNQRGALSLVNGIVYVTWSSHCDGGGYIGYVCGFNATNLLQAPVTFLVAPTGGQAGIWMSDQAPPADAAGRIFLTTGNGFFNGTTDFGECFICLTNTGTRLNVASWFAPYDWSALNGADNDLGSGGVLMIPGTTLLFSGGKAGKLYLVNGIKMGGLSSATSDTNIVQSWSLGSHQIHGGPVWWDGSDGSYAYVWAAGAEHLRQFKFDRTKGYFTTTNTPYATAGTTGGNGQPGGILSLSANGTNSGSGIVWASINTASSANQATVAGSLHAYDARNVTHELWNSDLLSARDGLGSFAKFVAPTVANGKVYMATFSNRLNVYGLFPQPALNVQFDPDNVVLTWPTNYAAGYVLQGNTDLASASWSNVASPIIISNGYYRTSIPATNAATFYRLKK